MHPGQHRGTAGQGSSCSTAGLNSSLWSIGDSSIAALLHNILTGDEACVAASLIFGEF
jgi:hypothetical protein